MASAMAWASLSRSRVSITSNSSRASRTLLVCSGPISAAPDPETVPDPGPAGLSFLHTVLAEHALACGQHRFDALPTLELLTATRTGRTVDGVARPARSGGYPVQDGLSRACRVMRHRIVGP
jgi:hypothetical protein